MFLNQKVLILYSLSHKWIWMYQSTWNFPLVSIQLMFQILIATDIFSCLTKVSMDSSKQYSISLKNYERDSLLETLFKVKSINVFSFIRTASFLLLLMTVLSLARTCLLLIQLSLLSKMEVKALILLTKTASASTSAYLSRTSIPPRLKFVNLILFGASLTFSLWKRAKQNVKKLPLESHCSIGTLTELHENILGSIGVQLGCLAMFPIVFVLRYKWQFIKLQDSLSIQCNPTNLLLC
jgi:hypothetical protein